VDSSACMNDGVDSIACMHGGAIDENAGLISGAMY
jgi:hypothetical protein